MVASAFNLNPLSYNPTQLAVYNKKGTDNGVRCDAGNLTLDNQNITYTVFIKIEDPKYLQEAYPFTNKYQNPYTPL